MSAEAVAWASDQLPPKGRAKELLMQLAAFADAEGVAWAAIGTLGEEMQLSDRSVQRLLRALDRGGFIVPTGRFHHRNVPYYQLALDRPGALAEIRAARRKARRTPTTNGDTDVTVRVANGDIGATPNGDTGVTRRTVEDHSGASAPDAGARDPEFLALVTAWADRQPGKVSPKLAWRAWSGVNIPDARLLAAGLRYLAEDEPAHRLGPMALHRWLTDGFYEAWLADPVRTAVAAPNWPGPKAVWAAVADAQGDAYAASWLGRARWDGERRSLLTRTDLAARRLRADFPAGLPGVDVIEKGSS